MIVIPANHQAVNAKNEVDYAFIAVVHTKLLE